MQECNYDPATGAITCQLLGGACNECSFFHASLCDENNAILIDRDAGGPATFQSVLGDGCIK